MTATPDSVPQDGAAQSRVLVQSFDAAGQPVPSLTVRLSLFGPGSLAPTTVVTGSDGKATAVYTAPAPGGPTTTATVTAAPAGSDAATATAFRVSIALMSDVPAPPTVPNSPKPTADFTFSPSAPVVGQNVFFNASASAAAVGHAIVGYRWDFGDGVVDTTSGVNASHQFSTPGTSNVSLTVTDEVGASATKTTGVSVGQGLPTANILVSKTGGLTVQADASGSFAAVGATIVSYTFIWGDGKSDGPLATPVASHKFPDLVAPATSETSTVTVRVTDNLGRIGTASQTVTVP